MRQASIQLLERLKQLERLEYEELLKETRLSSANAAPNPTITTAPSSEGARALPASPHVYCKTDL